MTDLPKRLEAAGRKEAEKYVKEQCENTTKTIMALCGADFRSGHRHLHPLIQKMAEALEKISVSSEGFYTEEKVMSEGHTEMEILDVDKIARDALADLEKYLEGV